MREEVPYEVLRIIAHKIMNRETLDGSLEYKIYIDYKEIINLIIEKENGKQKNENNWPTYNNRIITTHKTNMFRI